MEVICMISKITAYLLPLEYNLKRKAIIFQFENINVSYNIRIIKTTLMYQKYVKIILKLNNNATVEFP